MLLCKPRVSVAEVAVLCCVMTNYSNVLHDIFSNFNINVLLR
jgi:hypothetical protein